jgi:hypothetical protein
MTVSNCPELPRDCPPLSRTGKHGVSRLPRVAPRCLAGKNQVFGDCPGGCWRRRVHTAEGLILWRCHAVTKDRAVVYEAPSAGSSSSRTPASSEPARRPAPSLCWGGKRRRPLPGALNWRNSGSRSVEQWGIVGRTHGPASGPQPHDRCRDTRTQKRGHRDGILNQNNQITY